MPAKRTLKIGVAFPPPLTPAKLNELGAKLGQNPAICALALQTIGQKIQCFSLTLTGGITVAHPPREGQLVIDL